ncbi:hypothetical protein UUU_15780 [Klebsiella pneumoniae subsp. pneumoniae DSM 30104 = JCM 1662 = NBRC 14940]|nr:hypothetical protein KP13_31954 [Klebsiella pneumoniae subsp. pneumoniae Kp13]EJK91553.1 hypothetical protein UUU_15780 [Klebsiella pneumoniae subsp. pneumoniae DSM 30104 = JCM 1662 = NBRC 14940]CDL57843.1 hypothetical protein [Klebsiella pneumoniae]
MYRRRSHASNSLPDMTQIVHFATLLLPSGDSPMTTLRPNESKSVMFRMSY